MSRGWRMGVAAGLSICVVAVGMWPALAVPAVAPADAWTRQFGSASDERVRAITSIPGATYIAGSTAGALPSQSPAGSTDAYVRRFSTAGDHEWTRQFGTPEQDSATAIAATDQAVFVAGTTQGTLNAPSAGGHDGFLRRYATDGTILWTRQFGTSSVEEVYDMTIAGSRVYVVGYTGGVLGQALAGNFDAYLRVYDFQGNHLWTRQFGTSSAEIGHSVAATSTAIYVAGETGGAMVGDSFGGYDMFLRRYDLAGNSSWTRQFGTAANEFTPSVSASAAGVFVGGVTYGSFPGFTVSGETDGFLRRYTPAGGGDWTRQIGGLAGDRIEDLAATATGVIVTGATDTSVYGKTSAGASDAFVARYTAGGSVVWARQFGTSTYDYAEAAAASASGVYVGGNTYGAFPGQTNAGTYDAFVRRYVSYRPDAAISKTASSGYAGNDIYNTTAVGQNRSAVVARGQSQTFYVSAANDGDASDTFTFDGCASTTRFAVTYLHGTTDVTAKVAGGTFKTPTIAPGAAVVLRAVIRVTSSAPVGALRTCDISVTSGQRPALTDLVRAKVEAKA